MATEMTEEEARKRRELEELLARSRKTIAESQALIEQAQLRVAETDRFLASQGLTREQISAMRFTREQKLACNEELRRMGLPPLEEDDAAYDFAAATDELRALEENSEEGVLARESRDDVAARSRKFGTFMQAYRI